MSLGSHYIAEFYECNRDKLNDVSAVKRILTGAAELSGATIIKSVFHEFEPHGVSGVIVIAESHFAVHTWPEKYYAAVDLFSCGDFDYKAALHHIKEKLYAGRCQVSVIRRGIIPEGKTDPALLKLERVDL